MHTIPHNDWSYSLEDLHTIEESVPKNKEYFVILFNIKML